LEQLGEGRSVRVENNRNTGNMRRNLLERFQPFCPNCKLEVGESGDIAARPRQVLRKSLSDWIGHLHEYDRDLPRMLLESGRHRRAVGQDHIRG
jgi:hypothetical protein